MRARFGRSILFLTAASTYAVDRFTKLAALGSLSPEESFKVLPDIFHITLVLNSGAAFGMLAGRAGLFVVLSAIVITVIILFGWRHKELSPSVAVSLGLIMGGAAGNLVDRVRYGHVVDFLDFRVWPVFNVADSCITVGVALLVYTMIVRTTRTED